MKIKLDHCLRNIGNAFFCLGGERTLSAIAVTLPAPISALSSRVRFPTPTFPLALRRSTRPPQRSPLHSPP
eukprot:5803209-Pleurochrysis_carterae.AAC.5